MAPRKLFSALSGVVSLIVLLQGVFAGKFVPDYRQSDEHASWVDAHAWGAHIGTVLAIVLAVYAFVKLRSRKDLVYGSAALAVLFLVVSYLGGLMRDEGKDGLTVVHIPLALLTMALSVWLPVRARQGADQG